MSLQPSTTLSVFRGIAFWIGIVLAFAYPALIIAVDWGYVAPTSFLIFIGLHMLTLTIGHSYGQPGASPT